MDPNLKIRIETEEYIYEEYLRNELTYPLMKDNYPQRTA